ncbi:MAG: winged helix-turn-helix transcriptional regulator [Candidatus Marinimicrobia bacterium]|nr:winged helix-turn-helix transcriptional regulator [Candidatus Neomarinimicrobiota bacterium]
MHTEVKLFKSLSDINRIRILKMLEVRPLCVCEITEILGLAPSTVSKHLSLLRDAELINDFKDGKWVNYNLNQSTRDIRAGQILELMEGWFPDDETIKNDKQQALGIDRNLVCGS